MMSILLERIGFNNILLHKGIFIAHLSTFNDLKNQIQGSYPFLNKKFKDFSRTPFSAKKEPWVSVFFNSSTTWAISSWRSFSVCSFYAIENLGWIKLAPTAIFKDCQGKNSRNFKVLANPENHDTMDERHQNKVYRLPCQALFVISPLP